MRALGVDDDRLFRAMLGSVLELLILDLNMPGMSGEELVEMVRSVGGQDDLVVLVVTGAELNAADRERLDALGADAVLGERDAPEGVLAHVREHLRRKRA